MFSLLQSLVQLVCVCGCICNPYVDVVIYTFIILHLLVVIKKNLNSCLVFGGVLVIRKM